MGYLTTHVLDTANGCPGAGIDLTLRRLAPGDAAVLVERTTNADGRCDTGRLPRALAVAMHSLGANRNSEYFFGIARPGCCPRC